MTKNQLSVKGVNGTLCKKYGLFAVLNKNNKKKITAVDIFVQMYLFGSTSPKTVTTKVDVSQELLLSYCIRRYTCSF